MRYAICTVPAAAVRKDDAHRSEMVNQLLFGEVMEILEEKGDWLRIRSIYDDYEGWLTNHLVTDAEQDIAKAPLQYVTEGLINNIQFKEQLLIVPMGSTLPGFNEHTTLFWNGEFKGPFRRVANTFEISELINTAEEWLNVPYLWGGKTLMGVDCSGFVQTVFKLYDIHLKRDAYLQAEQGKAIELKDAETGDVAFFNNEKGRITHVGIMMNSDQIIHASGKVRIDGMSEKGIVNSENGKKTHAFHSLRRMSRGM
ncbi:MAG: NlpC/P60 family protein [Flavisolibacter sp.]